MKTRVFVAQETDHNILPAKKHGDLCVMISHKDFLSHDYGSMESKLYRLMQGIQPQDSVLCVGDPVVIGLAIAVALDLTDGDIHVLRWNKQRYDYERERILLS